MDLIIFGLGGIVVVAGGAAWYFVAKVPKGTEAKEPGLGFYEQTGLRMLEFPSHLWEEADAFFKSAAGLVEPQDLGRLKKRFGSVRKIYDGALLAYESGPGPRGSNARKHYKSVDSSLGLALNLLSGLMDEVRELQVFISDPEAKVLFLVGEIQSCKRQADFLVRSGYGLSPVFEQVASVEKLVDVVRQAAERRQLIEAFGNFQRAEKWIKRLSKVAEKLPVHWEESRQLLAMAESGLAKTRTLPGVAKGRLKAAEQSLLVAKGARTYQKQRKAARLVLEFCENPFPSRRR